MPPKLPPGASTELANIASGLAGIKKDDKNKASTSLSTQERFSGLNQEQPSFSASSMREQRELLQETQRKMKEQSSYYQDLVTSQKSPQIKPMSFAEEGEVIQAGLAPKINFDDSVTPEAQEDMLNAFYEVIASKDTSPLVRDVFIASAKKGALRSVDFSSTNLDAHNTEGGYMPEIGAMEIYNTNDISPEDAMRLFTHESTHVLQTEMRNNSSTREAVSGDYLTKEFKKDCTKDFKANGLRGKATEIARAMAYYREDEVSDEIHSKVMEEVFKNPEEAKKTFPNTLEKIEEIHKQYNMSLAQDLAASIGAGSQGRGGR